MAPETSIPVAEFQQRLEADSIEYIFDMRLEEEFKSWRIEGRTSIETLNIPHVDFLGEEEKYFDRFPRDKKMVAICAHGGASKYAAELLQEQGLNIVSLEGGMEGWSQFYETHKVQSKPDIYQILRVAKGCISHVIISEKEAVVIDAVRHTTHITNLVESIGARIVAVLDTHLQADHISGGREIAAQAGAHYYINHIDAADAAYQYTPLEDHVSIAFGNSEITAIHSPGHTPGSVSLLLDKRFLFTGDTIMKSSVGRPDLGGMAKQWAGFLYYTLFERYSSLADDIIILPTHAASFKEEDKAGVIRLTLGMARVSEIFQLRDKEKFITFIEDSLLVNPDRYQDIRMVNLGRLDADEEKKKELEIGKNLCGMANKRENS